MSKDIYANPDLTKKVRFEKGEKEDRNEDVCDKTNNVTIYDNYWAEGSTPPKLQDNTTEDQQQSIYLSVSIYLPVSYVIHTITKMTFLFAVRGKTLHFVLMHFVF